jgi:choline kinase
MHLVLLAAGKSSRIYNQINKHKCLIKIKKKEIINHLIDNSIKNKINKVTIITGYKKNLLKKKIKKKNVNFIYNKFYSKYEMVYSIYLALKNIKDDIIISYSDILYDEKIINLIVKKKRNNILIPIKKDWLKIWNKRKKQIFDDAETLKIKNQKLTEIGKKLTKISDAQGQFMGILYIPNDHRENLIKIILNLKLYKKQTTFLLNTLIGKKIDIDTIATYLSWYEFDDLDDLNNYYD